MSRGESRQDETTFNPLVYLVDDDGDFRYMIIRGLIRLGLDVQGFQDAPALYRAYAVRRANIVILDVGLSGEDGLAIAAHLRSSGPVGIIMATGRSSIEDRVEGLHRGADAYLVKPVDIRELAATVLALSQRLSRTLPPSAAFVDVPAPHKSDWRPEPDMPPPGFATPTSKWALEQGGWILSDGRGHHLRLTVSEQRILEHLLRERGQTVERRALIETLGENAGTFDDARLSTIVSRLRRRAQKVGMFVPIHGIRGLGFAFTE